MRTIRTRLTRALFLGLLLAGVAAPAQAFHERDPQAPLLPAGGDHDRTPPQAPWLPAEGYHDQAPPQAP
jgi:hypothetical protein